MGNAAEKINKLAEKNKIDKIIPYLNSKDMEARLAAVHALGKCGGDDAINALTTSIVSANDEEKIEIIKALGACGNDASFFLLSHYAAEETNPIIRDVMKDAMGQIHTRKHE